MKQSIINPTTNIIKAEMNDSDIDKAISRSGYPLQTIIANILRKSFYVQEEWSFIDNKTQEIRAIDMLAKKLLYKFKNFQNKKQPLVRPNLNLIIECKQSELPYVFFFSPNVVKTPNYPLLSGLFHKNIIISTDDDNSTYELPIIDCLHLRKNKFLINSAHSCMTFSKCIRKGKDILLSGVDAYQNLILPLVKSIKYFDNINQPPKTALYFDCHLTFGIGVIDAPMVGVKIIGDTHETELIPWVRVLRHESYESKDRSERQKIFSIDIIHKDFFEEYLDKNLLPFANRFASLILRHGKIIAEGKAFVRGMGKNHFINIEKRLEEKTFGKSRILPVL